MNAPEATSVIARRPSEARRSRVLIVDDHPIVRQGLVQLINQQRDLIVCGEAEDAPQTLEAIEKDAPDLALVDISLKGVSGIELLKTIKVRFPDLRCLVLSMHDETLYAERALRAGAMGYMMKHEASDTVVSAIHRVLRGEIYLSEKMSSRILHQVLGGRSRSSLAASPIDRLSDRELEVYRLIGEGRGTRQIAVQLHLSVKTVETHRARIKEKLDLKDANELVLNAIQWVQSQGQSSSADEY